MEDPDGRPQRYPTRHSVHGFAVLSAERAAVSDIRVVRSDGINGQVSDPRISRVRPIFVAAFAAAMLPPCTQSCDALSRGN